MLLLLRFAMPLCATRVGCRPRFDAFCVLALTMRQAQHGARDFFFLPGPQIHEQGPCEYMEAALPGLGLVSRLGVRLRVSGKVPGYCGRVPREKKKIRGKKRREETSLGCLCVFSTVALNVHELHANFHSGKLTKQRDHLLSLRFESKLIHVPSYCR